MEILGLLDTMESIILDGSKIPLTKKVLINEEKVLAIIDKMRLVVQSGGGHAKGVVGGKNSAKSDGQIEETTIEIREGIEVKSQEEAKAVEVLQQAYQMAKEIREGADQYADEVLANLEATSSRILRTIQAGRDRLDKTTKQQQPAKEEQLA